MRIVVCIAYCHSINVLLNKMSSLYIVEMSDVEDSGVVSHDGINGSDEEAGNISTPKLVLLILVQQF